MAHRPDYESADYKEGYEDGKREASKEWVGLSDEEITGVWNSLTDTQFYFEFASAIDAKLREKNG